jgi:hypothetical protein
MYVPPFKVIRDRLALVTVNGKAKVDITYDALVDLFKLLLRGTTFDETWYLSKYPDVAEAVAARMFRSGKHHFIEVGYFEGRRPSEFQVDESWYLNAYPDVAEGLKRGWIQSAREHFDQYGYDEGRSPSELG